MFVLSLNVFIVTPTSDKGGGYVIRSVFLSVCLAYTQTTLVRFVVQKAVQRAAMLLGICCRLILEEGSIHSWTKHYKVQTSKVSVENVKF